MCVFGGGLIEFLEVKSEFFSFVQIGFWFIKINVELFKILNLLLFYIKKVFVERFYIIWNQEN